MGKFQAVFLIGLIGIIFLSSCQQADPAVFAAEDTSTSLPTPTVTPMPTWTPTPSATPTPAPTSTPTPTFTPTPFVCSNLQGQTLKHKFDSEAMGEEIAYLVHLPPCYDSYPDSAFPVLYLFHGWPMNETHWDQLGIDELADDWISRWIIGPFIIVLPGVRSDGRYVNSSGGPGSFEGMVVDDLIPLIDSTYRTLRDPAGRAVGGISRGGVWSLEIGLRHPDLFGIVGGHSPSLSLNYPLPQYDPFLLVEDERAGQRFYLDAGDGDWARAGAIRLRDLFIEKGVDVTYELHEGAHVDELWQNGLVDYIQFYTAEWPKTFESLPKWEAAPVMTPTVAPSLP
ncbi:MAG: hypothetical protein JW981_05870 [Anaerolineae bacterium]|nr:hypothetical protein [Anaerolineae bacterium]